jgi:hypothetical protein
MTLHMLTTDPQYAVSLAGRLSGTARSDDDETLMCEYLKSWAEDLISELRNDSSVAPATAEYAWAWVGTNLADRVREAAEGFPSADRRFDVLLTVAAATGDRGSE